MKLLVDMDLSPRWVDRMAEAGITAVHWSTVGQADAPDTRILNYAREHGMIVLTHDLDFGAILAATKQSGPSHTDPCAGPQARRDRQRVVKRLKSRSPSLNQARC